VNRHLVTIVDPDGYTLMEIVSALTNMDMETYCQQMVVPLLPAITQAFGQGRALILPSPLAEIDMAIKEAAAIKEVTGFDILATTTNLKHSRLNRRNV